MRKGRMASIISFPSEEAFLPGYLLFLGSFGRLVHLFLGNPLGFFGKRVVRMFLNGFFGGFLYSIRFLFLLFRYGFRLGFCLGGFIPGIWFFNRFDLFGFFLGFLLRCIDEGIGNLRASGSLLLPSRSPAHDEPGVVIGSRPVLLQIVGYQGYGSEEIGITDIFGLDVLQGVGYEGFHLVDVVGHAHG